MSFDDIKLTHLPGATRISVWAKPGSHSNAIVGSRQGQLVVSVRARPQDGRANDAVCKVLARCLGVSRSSVDLVSGLTSRRKTIHISDLEPSQVLERLTRRDLGFS